MGFEQAVVMVAGEEVDHRHLGVPRDAARVDVALATFRRLRREAVLRQRHDELGRELDRVHELALRGSRMHREPVNRHADGLGRERLDLELAQPRAVERVRQVRAELVEVEVLGSATDLLVDRERDPRGRPAALRGPDEVGDGRHDLRHSGLVVRPEERRAVARDDVVADALGERGELRGIEDLAGIAGQLDQRAVPGAVHDRRDVRARHVGRRVDVRDEPDDRGTLLARQRCEHRRRVGQPRVFESQLDELLDEEPREIELLLRARPARSPVRRLRVDSDVAQEAPEHVVGELCGQCRRVRSARQSRYASSPSRTKTSRIVATPSSSASSRMFSFGAWTLHSLSIPNPVASVGSPRSTSAA